MSNLPWRNWYHCMANTYGTWLPGDDRGFRTRHHREHVEGDYKNPPPLGKYAGRHRHAVQVMKRDAVLLDWEARVMACKVMVEAFLFHGIEIVELCATKMHVHALARFTPWPGERIALEDELIIRPSDDARSPRIGIRGLPPGREARQAQAPKRSAARTSALDDPPRHYMGIAKKQSARALAEAGLAAAGGVWAKRGKIVPIEDRPHFAQVLPYIRDHVDGDGAVYSLICSDP